MAGRKTTWLLAAAALAVGASLTPVPVVRAGQLYVESLSAACTDITAPCGFDPNLINPASIYIGFAGNHSAISPLLIIVGVPNAGSAPTISLPTGVDPAAAAAYYGLNNDTSGTTAGVFEGSLASTGCSDAYACAGLMTGSGGGPSESWVNWNGFNSANGVNDGTSFSLYAYAIDYALNGGKGGNSPINIDFTGLATGAIVIAYNCAESGSTCTRGDIGETPFTNAGENVTTDITPIPEPATLTLLGSGLCALGGILRRRLRIRS